MGVDEILRRYILEHEIHMILAEAHGGETVGHYVRKAIAHNILKEGLWWPTLHKYVKEYC